jgi:hypothetical protein
MAKIPQVTPRSASKGAQPIQCYFQRAGLICDGRDPVLDPQRANDSAGLIV